MQGIGVMQNYKIKSLCTLKLSSQFYSSRYFSKYLTSPFLWKIYLCHVCISINFIPQSTSPSPWATFHKAFFQWQVTKISDKSADNQSEARISVAYNLNCHLSLTDKFCETPPWSLSFGLFLAFYIFSSLFTWSMFPLYVHVSPLSLSMSLALL